jgi:hypothetical protein
MKLTAHKTVLVLVSVLALVLGTTALADAAKPAYKVTLRTGAASSVADRFIAVSGKVVGPKAVGRTVTIQRKYVGGSWVTVTTATIRRNGTYAARVETPRGGTTSFRAVKARSSVRSGAVSAARSVPVYRWLYLSDQPGETSNAIRGVDETIGGKHYPHSIEYFGDGYMEFKLAKLCTRLTTLAAYLPNTTGAPAADATFELGTFQPSSSTGTTVTTGTPVPINVAEVGTMFGFLDVNDTEGGYHFVLGDPKVYCNADVLPTWQNSEID